MSCLRGFLFSANLRIAIELFRTIPNSRTYEGKEVTMLEVINLSKRYKGNDSFSLKDVNFSVGKGEIVGLVGKNGAGKTTLMKMIAKSQKPTEGIVKYGGQDIFSTDNLLEPFGIMIGAVFYPYLSAEDNLRFYLKLHGKSKYVSNIKPTLQLVDLWNKRDRKPKDFSFGMKQRLALAICMVDEPEFMILDEPFIGLDPDGMQALISVLKKWANNRNTSILISSHQLAELEEICGRYLFLEAGTLKQEISGQNQDIIVITLMRPIDDYEDFAKMHPEVISASDDGRILSVNTSKGSLNNVLSELTITCGVQSINKKQQLNQLFGKETR